MLSLPPPIPADAASPVVAGPVLSAGSMWWVEGPGDRLVVRRQDKAGRVRRAAVIGRPESASGAMRPLTQRVLAFSVSGRHIALVHDATYTPPQFTCGDPCYAPFLIPVAPFERALSRGTPGHVRTAASADPYRSQSRCRVPDSVAWSAGRLVTQSCVSETSQANRIRIERRRIATGEQLRLVGARDRWVSYEGSGVVTVRRVDGPQLYRAVPRGDFGVALSTGGRIAVRNGGTAMDPCRPGNAEPVGSLATAGPRRPALRHLIDGVSGGPVAAFGSTVAFVARAAGCPRTWQTRLAGPNGRVVAVGAASSELPFGLDVAATEVAVLDRAGLRRYPR